MAGFLNLTVMVVSSILIYKSEYLRQRFQFSPTVLVLGGDQSQLPDEGRKDTATLIVDNEKQEDAEGNSSLMREEEAVGDKKIK